MFSGHGMRWNHFHFSASQQSGNNVFESDPNMARFAPHGVNRSTSGFFKNMGPYRSHSVLLLNCLEAIVKCNLYMEIFYFSDFNWEKPHTKTFRTAQFAPTPLCCFSFHFFIFIKPSIFMKLSKEIEIATRTRPDTRLPQSRAGGQGLFLRSFDHLGKSSDAKDRKTQKK